MNTPEPRDKVSKQLGATPRVKVPENQMLAELAELKASFLGYNQHVQTSMSRVVLGEQLKSIQAREEAQQVSNVMLQHEIVKLQK